MRTGVIQCRDISKTYRLGESVPYRTLRERLTGLLLPRSRGSSQTGYLRALSDITFSVSPGEVVGLIGRNGAGKSTLLKILSRITPPTSGYAEICGRVGSLLEVGTGFQNELTGRENIFLNGTILGMKRDEVRSRFDEIVAFAECERFLDTPIKHYSSGMAMRLAFSIAAHLEAEVLLIDEVLAVGDSAFQKKCLGRISQIAGQGRTILFVSHNMVAVQGLCSRAICLESGAIQADGSPQTVIPDYLERSIPPRTEQVYEVGKGPGNEKIRLLRAAVRPRDGSSITVRTPIEFEFDYSNFVDGIELDIGINLYNEQMILLFSTGINAMNPAPPGVYRMQGVVPGDLLNNGMHSVELIFSERLEHLLFRSDSLLRFEVQDSDELRNGWYDRWPGLVRPHLIWTNTRIEEQ